MGHSTSNSLSSQRIFRGSEQRDRNWKNKKENGNIALTEAKKISEGGGSTSSISTRSFEPNCQAREKRQEICAISYYEADKALFGDFEVVIQSEFDLDSQRDNQASK
ncbi:hypothetical protein GBA52_008042 [Prunus armeniaca]|nr:hypothetical protein GBA52_008042 [Prunus armeniaca]